jgi:hypothetical protein
MTVLFPSLSFSVRARSVKNSTKKPQPETRGKALPQSSGVAVRPVVGPKAPSRLTAPIGFPISSFVPVGRRRNIRLESMQKRNMRKNTATWSAANFCINGKKLRRYCAVQ